MIEELDYDEGENDAYIRFSNETAAIDACRGMKNYPLGGPDHCIFVDFARF